jgi:Fic family protein
MAPMKMTAEDEWIACTYKTVPWRQQVRAGSKEDRMVRSIRVCIPALIASRTFNLRADLVSKGEAAISAISALDNSYGDTLKSLDRLLIRAESIASSKIEDLHATPEEYARALYGNNSNSSAVAMVAGTKALTQMIDSVESGKPITEEVIKQAHKTLMQDVQREQESAGKYRAVQNWIQGSNHSPLGAIFVPPPPEYVAQLMKDLLNFVNRDDLPVLAQAAIAHAQFETIHPFTDGNGRIGRALVNVILRRRNITTRVVVPIASLLVSDRSAYFDILDKYRDGQMEGLLRGFIKAANIAATQSTRTASALNELPAVWRKKLGRVRSGGSTALLLSSLISKPVFSADELIGDTGANSSSIYNAITRLQEVGIIAPLSERKRNQIWGAVDVLQELEGLDSRISLAGRNVK